MPTASCRRVLAFSFGENVTEEGQAKVLKLFSLAGAFVLPSG